MTNYLLNALTTLFVTVDPIGLAPIFLALTPGWSRAARRVVAIKASAVAFGILLAFALVGNALLGFLGVGAALPPLAIPLIAGPGAISAVILLADHAPSKAAFGAMIATIALVLGSTLAIFLAAPTVDRFLGATGRAVLTRLLGVILAALAVQFVADGVITLAKTV